jgi:23S rRNA (uracil1939-C5)-methyltransferase
MKRRYPVKKIPAVDRSGRVPEQPIEAVIERIIPGGLGLAHADGQTVMIPLTAPGDRIKGVIERKAGKVSFARVVEIVEPSPARVAAPCQYFGVCGGCDLQQLNYAAQLAAKSAMITDCLRRIAGVTREGIEVTPSPDPWAYRSRAEWQCEPDGQRVGYFERGSHRVCDVVECPILTPVMQDTLTAVRERMNGPDGPIGPGEIQAAEGDDGVSVSPAAVPGSQTLVHRQIGEFRYQFGAENFFQANVSLLPALIETVAGAASGRMAVDLYCGVGLFSLPLARRFESVHGVEAVWAAVEVAEWNAAEANLSNVQFHAAPAAEWLAEVGSSLGQIDLLVLDPPRTGAGRDAIRAIIAAAPRRIVYVSCDPATLSRDAKQLAAAGYELGSVTGFDLFPQTHHVETVAVFDLPTETEPEPFGIDAN